MEGPPEVSTLLHEGVLELAAIAVSITMDVWICSTFLMSVNLDDAHYNGLVC